MRHRPSKGPPQSSCPLPKRKGPGLCGMRIRSFTRPLTHPLEQASNNKCTCMFTHVSLQRTYALAFAKLARRCKRWELWLDTFTECATYDYFPFRPNSCHWLERYQCSKAQVKWSSTWIQTLVRSCLWSTLPFSFTCQNMIKKWEKMEKLSLISTPQWVLNELSPKILKILY